MSKCRGDRDLGLCTTPVLAFGELQRNGRIRFFLRRKTFFSFGFCRCAAVLQTQVPKLCADLDLGLLYILILGTYSKFALENKFLALGVCFPQLCSSAGYRFSSSILRFFRLSRPPKGLQNRQTEKGKGSKIPKILQKREILAGVELNMCTWKLRTQWTIKISPNINVQFDTTLCVLWITINFIKLTHMTQRDLIQSCCFCR